MIIILFATVIKSLNSHSRDAAVCRFVVRLSTHLCLFRNSFGIMLIIRTNRNNHDILDDGKYVKTFIRSTQKKTKEKKANKLGINLKKKYLSTTTQ